ncbi:hypothetical protein GCM10025876_24640 [Demequina litorisediminis]|uniref:50S ribosomal protein L13 n=1 Tax=Demequina litorisediminis TaxID=1849022 RepID=A0ABQ6IEN6_9MICO|nr:hypothetical protein GCM10025876_24640 [Demequina litorisediminis]
MRTYSPKPGDVTKNWYVIDATDVVLGRLASQAASLLRGKHKATFAPHVDGGDFVIVINADKISLSGSKPDRQDGLPPLRPPGRSEGRSDRRACSRRTRSASSRTR